MVTNTLRALVFAASAILLATTAHAAPLLHQGDLRAAVSLAENVRIVCEEDGNCYRLRGRRPVARWVYGDGNFHGPYVGPGNYGSPGRHYGWWWFD
jgi:hypothetical protein